MEVNFIKELRELNKVIKAYLDNTCDTHDFQKLNMTQMNILGFLFRHEQENVCQKDLEKDTGLKKASITGALDSLERKNIIRRVTADDDRRKNYIVLTERVERFRKEIDKLESEFNRQISKNVTDEEKESFLKIISKLQNNVGKIKDEADI